MLWMEFSRKRNVFPDRGPLCVGVLPPGENRCMADRVGQILGNYQLLRLLGRGAFAEVYLAEHRYLVTILKRQDWRNGGTRAGYTRL